MNARDDRSRPTTLSWPLSIGGQLVQGALVGIGELVDRVVKPEQDPLNPSPASITTLTTDGGERR